MSREKRQDRLFCWEILHSADSLLPAVRELYETALEHDERVPWEWLERGVKTRNDWRPGGWGKHIVVASPEPETKDQHRLAGFASVVHIPGYGGYLSYLAVNEAFRGQGVGGRLFEQAANLMAVDASAVDEELPFVIWESRRPDATASAQAWKVWAARLKLFHKAGGLWVDGVTLHSPNWMEDSAATVPLQLFVAPRTPKEEFDTQQVRDAVSGLLEKVYRASPGDAVYDTTLPSGCCPRLRPTMEAARLSMTISR